MSELKPPENNNSGGGVGQVVPITLSIVSLGAAGGVYYLLNGEIDKTNEHVKKLDEMLVSTALKVQGLKSNEALTVKLGEAFHAMQEELEGVKRGSNNIVLGLRSIEQKIASLVEMINFQQEMIQEVQDKLKQEGYKFRYETERKDANRNNQNVQMQNVQSQNVQSSNINMQGQNMQQRPKMQPQPMNNQNIQPQGVTSLQQPKQQPQHNGYHNQPQPPPQQHQPQHNGYQQQPPQSYQPPQPNGYHNQPQGVTSLQPSQHLLVNYHGDITGETNRMLNNAGINPAMYNEPDANYTSNKPLQNGMNMQMNSNKQPSKPPKMQKPKDDEESGIDDFF